MSQQNFYQECLKHELDRRLQRNRSYSLRAFAKALDLEPGALSQFLAGKRIPSYKIAEKILKKIDLSPEQKSQFLNSLAKTHQDRGLKRMNPKFREMDASAPAKELSADLFRVIGDWYHYAVLLLAETEGFKPDSRWICPQLGISALEAKLAFDRLTELELLQEVNGKYRFVDENITTANKGLTTSALKRRQNQILEKAIDSLENDPIEIRSMTGMTMAIDPEKIPEAKQMILDFNRKLSKFFESGRKKEVYELQISFFPLQKRRSES